MFGCFLGIDEPFGGYNSNVPSFVASLAGLTTNPNFGQVAEIGVELTAQAINFSDGVPPVITYQWQKSGQPISGATAASYTPVVGDDLTTLHCVISATGYGDQTTPGATVRFAPPVVTSQPSISPLIGPAGTVFSITEPVAVNTTITLTTFTLSGADKSSELSGLSWNSSGEAAGPLFVEFRVENSGGSVTSFANATVEVENSVEDLLNITTSRTLAIGEQAILFEVDFGTLGDLVATDPRKDIIWDWDFGEVGALYKNAHPDMHWANNPSHKQGPRVGHTFTTYGAGETDFTVRVTGRDKFGNIETGSTIVTVRNPEAHSWNASYVVSFSGNFSGAPAGSTQITSESAMRSAMSSEAGRSKIRFLFRAGETFNLNNSSQQLIDFAGMVGTFGGTQKAIISTNMGNPGSGKWTQKDLFRIGTATKPLVIKDLELRGEYDPVTGTCTDTLFNGFVSFVDTPEITFHNVKSRGTKSTFVFSGANSDLVFFSDCDIGRWHNYGCFIAQSNNPDGCISVFGGTWTQDPVVGPLFTGDGKGGLQNTDFPDHGPFRMGIGARLCINDVWFGSFNTWFNNNAPQPCLRLYRATQAYSHEWYLNRVHLDNGGLAPDRQNNNTAYSNGGLLIVDKLVWRGQHLISGSKPFRGIGGAVIRNTVWYDETPNGPLLTFEFPDLTGVGASVDPDVYDIPIEIYNNTIVTFRNNGTFDPFDIGGVYSDVTLENNIIHAPNVGNSGSFDPGTFLDTKANLFRPQQGSPHIDAATGPFVTIDDFDAVLRGSTQWVGPFDAADNAVAGLGLEGPHDFYVDAVNGSDANDGLTEANAVASLNAINETLLNTGQTTKVLVKPGLYGKATDYIKVNNATTTGATLQVAFVPGAVIDGSAYAGNESAFDPLGNAFEFRVYGNGAEIRNVTTTSGNALGGSGDVTCHYYNFSVDGCVDGMTLHNTSVGHFHDIAVTNCTKSGIAHVNSSSAFHYRCSVTEAVGGGSANVVICDAGSMYFEDCVLVPDANGGTLDLDGATLVRSQLGTETKAAKIIATAAPADLSNCFVNLYADGNCDLTMDKCFGKFSVRSRNGGAITVTNCVFNGHASSQNRTVFSNYNPGSSSPFILKDTIFAGSYTYSQLDANNAGYLVAAGSEFHNNFLADGKVYDADLVAADTGGTVIQGTLTSDPLIGAADTLSMADYAFAAGSPAIGAGTTGNDVGFGTADVEERIPMILY